MRYNIPEPKYFKIDQLSKRWSCSKEDVLHYASLSQLELGVISNNWHMERGDYEDTDDDSYYKITTEIFFSSNQYFGLFVRDIKDLIKHGHVFLTSFFTNNDDYLCISNNYPDVIKIDQNDLLASLHEVNRFEGSCLVKQPVFSEYISPYMSLMFEAIKELKITESNQLKKAEIKSWFLGKKLNDHVITDNEAEKLASFVRLPTKGGNKKMG